MRVGKGKPFPLVGAALFGVVLMLSACAQGGGGDAVTFDGVLNGTDIARSDPNSPIELTDAEPAELSLTVRNASDQPVSVRYIRFEGEVIDMIFLTYDTAIRVDLEPGAERELPVILLDFFDLGGQASGFLRGHIELYDEDREVLGSEPVFFEASGEGLSTLEIFNVVLLLATGLGAAWNLLRLSQRRLPANRAIRALRFAAVGAGAGLTLSVAFSTLRIWPLPTVSWVVITVIGALIGYVVGFILPGSGDEEGDLDEDELLAAVAQNRDQPLTGAGARSTVVSNDD